MVQPHQQETARQVECMQSRMAVGMKPFNGIADWILVMHHSFEGFSSGKGVKVAGGAATAPSTSSSQTTAAAPAASKATAGQQLLPSIPALMRQHAAA